MLRVLHHLTLSSITALSLALPAVATCAHAQAPALAAAQGTLTGCTYDTCALRLDYKFFGGVRVRTGLDGESKSVGIFNGQIATSVARVPAALAEARAGRSSSIKSFAASLVTTAATLAIIYGGNRDVGIHSSRAWTALGVGAVGSTIAGVTNLSAQRHFSRAVWLYNREIPR
jgi:hypothetical protein